MRSFFNLLSIAIAVFLGSVAFADTPQEIMQKLQGRWTIEDGVNQGVDVPEERLDGCYTIITADTIISYDRDKKETYKAKYTLNTLTSPVQIDMVAMQDGREATALGIIKFEWINLDGEKEFSLCYSLTPGARPTKFESPEGSTVLLFELQEADSDDLQTRL